MKNGASVQECTTSSTEYVIQKPCSGSNVMVSISKDEPTAFNFGLEDIKAMKLLTGGAMMITFNDGSTLTINNFEQAKASFPFTDVAMSDGTVMNLQKVATGLAGTLPQDSVADLTILKPQGTIGATEFNLQQGKTYTLGFNMSDVAGVEQKGTDLIVSFKDGTHMTLHNYTDVAAGALPPQMTLADGSVIPVSQLINVLNVASAQQVKAVEPAAGEETHAHHAVAHKAVAAEKVATAQDLANIEPAAGAAGGPGGAGYGFNSSVDPANITPIGAIGPIGPTALAFGLPTFIDAETIQQPQAATPFTTLTATDKFTFEDTPVNLQIAAAGDNPTVDQLTVTVSNIPTGWTVDIAASGGGTFNAATGTYTIALPTGQSYAGGPVLMPPHDSDADIRLPTHGPLHVTLDVTDTTTNTTTTTTTDMNVTVDAVADQPDLAVQNVSGSDNVPLPLNISAHVVDTDGSETLTTATLSGIPAGFTVNGGGATLNNGVWTVDANQLSTLTLTAPHGFDGSFVVTVRVNNEESHLTDSEITLANNTNFNTESFLVTFTDTAPIVGTSSATVDDTGLSGGPNVATGNVSINYQLDTPGTFAPQNTFTAGGSLLGGALASDGHPVAVALAGNTYTGTANGQTIFTMVVNADGTYTFTQFHALDHADGNNANDSIALNFTVGATDSDGDTTTSTITINVLDDAPVAHNDTAVTSTSVTGNVETNDTLSQDAPNTITQIVYNGATTVVPTNGTNVTIVGQYGTLVINSTGAYTYTSNNTGTGTDNFQYTLHDFDGDTSTAVLGATVNGIDTVPVIGNSAVTVDETNLTGGPNIISGTVPADFLSNGPGNISATSTFTSGGSLLGGALSSHGSPVSVTLAANTYTGKDANGTTIFTLVVEASGHYTFTQFHQLDHADGSNPNDSIALNFTVVGTDTDGDTDTGVITVNVLDDAPVAINDNFVSATATATGNILTNDIAGQDTPLKVFDVTFGGQTVTLNTNGSNSTITNASGTLVINNTGAFTFTPPTPGQGVTFTYHNIDFDGDKSVVDAQHGQVVIDTNGVPTITGSSVTVDETTLFDTGAAQTVAGTYTFTYGGDGQGAGGITNTGYTGPALTSGGHAVTVALVGNVYTGTANGVTIFTMTVNTNGTYSFTQFHELDHPNANDANDALNLTFGLQIADADGSTATGTLTAIVLDDGPVAVNDSFVSATGTASGNILTNDRIGADQPGHVYDVTFGGQTVVLNTNGTNSTITNASGTLVINNTGAFTFTPPTPGAGVTFTYHDIDFDGDRSVVDAQHGTVVIDTNGVPTITGSSVTVDETTLFDTGAAQTVAGTYTFTYGGDGQGAGGITNTGYTGPALTSGGHAVTVALVGNVYTGIANGVTIFTMTVNTNGTYSFTQFHELDHPNANDPNDALNLTFGLQIADADGSTATGTLTAIVLDDGPVAVNDSFVSATGTASGNILTNDRIGADQPGHVYDVTFGGQTVVLNTNGTNSTITNASGTLVINNTGVFTFTPPVAGQGVTFTYHDVDFDGDRSVVDAQHGTVVIDTNGLPTITGSAVTVDETNLANTGTAQSVTGNYTFNYGGDGQGAGGISLTGYNGPALTSHGTTVALALSGNTITGTANGQTIFTMVVNTNGTYTFTQFHELDHPNANDPNDALNLTFGVQITDADGSAANATLTAIVLDDGPVAVNDTFLSSTTTASGNIISNDHVGADVAGRVFDVTFGGQTVNLPADGSNVTITNASGTLVINTGGSFTYTPPTPGGGATFTYHLVDFDGDRSVVDANHGTVVVDTNAIPVIGDSTVVTDETSLISGPSVTTGAVSASFFGDGPGTIQAQNTFTSGGSLLGGALTSHGVAVGVTLSGNTYTGKAGGVTVFTLTVANDGSYTFTQFKELDHANGSDPNDIISLNFTVRGTDADGDTDTGVITVNVRDDAPSALDDIINLPNGALSTSGNVLTNDTPGQDTPVPVVSVVFGANTYNLPQNGTNVTITAAHGTLVINSTGAYTYTSANTTTGTDSFTYTIRDYDGDTSTAHLSVTIADIDTVPVIGDSEGTVDESNLISGPQTATGVVSSNYFSDGPGTITAVNNFSANGSLSGGTLKSHGNSVTVSLSGNTYTGTANGVTIFTLAVAANGSYTFTQFHQLDHADGTNPNDVINLNFSVLGTDSDGDTDTGTITIHVLDDAPIAVNDSFISTTATATGNILTNDIPGQDTPVRVNDVTFGGQTVTLNANGTNTTITNSAGTLVINTTGQFTYTPPQPGNGTTFTYHLIDYDGDISQAGANANQTGTVVVDTNGTPTIVNTTTTVYESGSHTTTGVVTGNFFGDGPGTFITCGAFNATGSLMGGHLSAGGFAVTVTNTGSGYVGTANGQTVFTLTVAADGSYTFNLLKALDHADGTNPNDIIGLNFEVCGRDQDGDIGHGTLTVNVVDGAPIASPDAVTYCTHDYFHNGNMITGFNPGAGTVGIDTMSFDTPTTVYQVSGAGGSHAVSSTGVTEIDGQYGHLYVFANGAYVYYATVDGDHTDTFTYYLKDFDGDSAAATLSITAQAVHSANASIIEVHGNATGNDGNNALISYDAGVNDTVFGGGGDDVIMSWTGNDTLHGGSGNDALFGEYGSDVLYGDAGADVFVADHTDFVGGYAGKFTDTVMDFHASEGDVLDLSALVTNGSAAQAAIDSYVRAVNQGGNTMLQVNNQDGSGWHDAMIVAGQTNMDVHTLLNNGNLDV